MAKDQVDPIAITRADERFGGVQAKFGPTGRSRLRRIGRKRHGDTRGHPRSFDNIRMGQMKADIAALHADQSTYDEIAERMSDKYGYADDERLTASAIHFHIKRMNAYWREKALARIDERQAIVLSRLEQIEALAIEGYFASMEGKYTHSYHKQVTRARGKDRIASHTKKEKKRRKEALEVAHSSTAKKGHIGTPLADGSDIDKRDDLMILMERKINMLDKLEENTAGDPKFLAIILQCTIQRGKVFQLFNKREDSSSDGDAIRLTDEQREKKLVDIIQQAKDRRSGQTSSMLADAAPLGGFGPDEAPKEDTEEEITWADVDEDSNETEDELVWD